MAGGKLTARKVETLRKPGRYGDGAGLWLHIGRTGGKSWVLRYQFAGRAREMGLGAADLVPLAEARTLAQEARRKIHIEKIDPLAEREAERAAQRAEAAAVVTFEEAAGRYIASHEGGWRNEKHRNQWRNTLATYAFPILGPVSVAAIDTGLVLKVLEPVWHGKPETASRLRGRIESVLDWAAARKLRSTENPARWKGHLDKLLPARGKLAAVKHHAAVPWREMPATMARLEGAEGVGALALRFTVLTACRSGEVRGALWPEIDMEAREWVIPAERMKAKKEHRVPLSDAAVAILEAVRPMAGPDGLVFSARAGRPLSDMTLTAVLRRLGIEATAHGFRSSFSDWAAESTNYPHEVREMALAHTISSAVERAYRRGDLFERRRRLMQEWANYCGSGDRVPHTTAQILMVSDRLGQ